MNWEDTLIKSTNIKWNRPRIKSTNDGKLDFDLHIPLTELFRGQAKTSFAHGMMTMMQFHVSHQEDNKEKIELKDVVDLFNECGLPEIAKKLTRLISTPTHKGGE